MGNHHDSIALDWVRGEIQDTLTQGQHALEAYVENRDDTARLRFCLNYLHQVHGTLQMVELYGAALLTEEMEKLTQAVLNKTVANTDEAVEVLMQAILQLPQYLEHLASSQDDFPMVLLPLLNDLRAARGESLLSDTSLFKPDLAPSRITVAGKVSRRLQDPTVLGHIRKLRQMYQFALAGVIREADLHAHFEYMQKVIQRLIRLCQKTPRGELWKVASAFVETLQAHVNPVNAAVKSLLRELDSEIRRLTDEHTDILQQPVPEALLKHLLYYVARARDLGSPQVSALQDAYRLNQALPSEDDVDAARTRASGPGRDAIHSVVGALNEELTKLKDQLDLYVRSELRQNSELEDLLPGLRQVANTLAVLGLAIPRKVITEQVELVAKLSAKTEQVDDGTLMDIAGALLYVEASLAGLDREEQPESSAEETSDAPVNLGSRELGEASGALLRESRNTLEQVKSAIVNFIASQWDVREIEQVPGLLHSIRGGLSLIPLDRVADILTSTERYITEVLLNSKQTPDWKQLDILADAVTSIEYYLERLAEGIGENDSILRVAEDSLASLGFPVGAEPTWSASAEEKIPVVGPLEEPPETSVTAAREATRSSDTELLDDEILGIFIEEAEEVLETIHEFYPRLRQNHDDREALTEVRRAFHTLKGSGRLVGATSIGELAWSVENLLNRLIDQTIHATGDMFALMDEVNVRIPSLIREFKEGQTAGDVEALINRAEAMATTRRTDDEAMAETGTPGLEGTTAGAGDEEQETTAPTEDKNTAETVSGESTDDNDLIDDEILEIFVEEAGEVLDTIHEYLPMLLRRHDDRSALSEIRRAFHTLKGSGRMVGALVIGELAWSVENMLNRVIDGSIFMNSDIASLLEDVTANLPALVEDFERHRAPSVDTSNLEARANALANGEIPDASMMPVAESNGSKAMAEAETGAADAETTEEDAVDPVLLDIFESETESHLQTLKDFLSTAGDKTSVTYTDDLSRALHTLKGSAHTAGIDPIAAVITPLERFVKESRARNKRANRDVLSLIESACDFLTQGLAQIRENPQVSLPGTKAFLEKLDRLAEETLRSHSEEAPRQHPQQAPSRLVQLFLNEGLDIVLDADRILDHWAENPGEMASLNPLRSELEQLTSGASEAGLGDVAALAGALKETYDEAAKHNEAPNQMFFETVRAAHEQLINMMDQVAAGLATESSDDVVTALEGLKQTQAPENQKPDAFEQEFTGDLEEIDLSFEVDETETPASEEPATTEQPPLPETSESGDEMDEELAEIFLEEARELIDSTAEALQSWSENTGSLDILRLLQRDLHTLKGGARLADIPAVGDLSHELENLFEGLAEQRLSINDELADLLFRCHDRLAGMVENLEAREPPRPAPDLIGEVQAYMDSANGTRAVTNVASQDEESEPGAKSEEQAPLPDMEEPEDGVADLPHLSPELVGIFLEEGLAIYDAISECLDQWRDEPEELTGLTQLQQELHTLKGSARLSDVDPIASLAEAWSGALDPLISGSNNQKTLLSLSDRALGSLKAMLNSLEDGNEPKSDTGLIEDFQAAHEVAAEETAAPREDSEQEAIDPEVLEIFLEEAGEILDQLEQLLGDWRKEPANHNFNQEAQRALHTLKGGARLSQLTQLGDRAHAFETRLIDLGGNAPDESQWQAITDDHDAIIALVADIRKGYESGSGVPEPAKAEQPAPATAEPKKPEESTPSAKAEKPVAPVPKPEKSPAKARKQAAEAQRAAQETIRVSAPLLDELVNLAGETSITRGRLEQQTSDFGYTLDEMAATIERLREQLRRMEIETETQILFSAEKEHGPDYGDDFDPLEMDRYSSIQQLSRALTESSSDLADLRETLSDRVRDTETLLVQQSRINTELQEGLMKTRMIPFASMVPRLRRIVRQISGELGKKVAFDVRNAEGEMDRNILERMIAPLEHMLRNALDHGIESPADRKKAGKPETGEVTLSMTREGGDVVLRMIDDGAGVPSSVIRDKAIRQGLLREDEELSEREILQFILQPGLTTARQVTQISGRGVGMDVVASEIKQLGGSLDIDSAVGRGTTFTVRLPFTVSVNRALMVSTGEDFYAIPLNTIEGIVRVSTYELEEYYKPDAPLYEYAGQEYRLQYLGSLLNSDHQPKLQGQALPLPVILVRGAEQPLALQVDNLIGSREIVVKSLGPQFSSVRGVSGATILGDGNVVVILDLPAMIRSDILSERQRLTNLENARESARYEEQGAVVMVVDDSVTVRKVTSRLLERNGMEVITAKDGLDAVAQLQDHKPDIILLDIEMPRMDGFEVASFVRHDDNLRETPICMITSRTGEKHRERALAIGVNEYLGKPFQEAELLETIKRLTGRR
ncbi:MAG: Hpt domain-containing protein [Pseudomonadota bacterium]|nr:Hpt domain-containing protein [Pseudomonadota bacterium]